MTNKIPNKIKELPRLYEMWGDIETSKIDEWSSLEVLRQKLNEIIDYLHERNTDKEHEEFCKTNMDLGGSCRCGVERNTDNE